MIKNITNYPNNFLTSREYPRSARADGLGLAYDLYYERIHFDDRYNRNAVLLGKFMCQFGDMFLGCIDQSPLS